MGFDCVGTVRKVLAWHNHTIGVRCGVLVVDDPHLAPSAQAKLTEQTKLVEHYKAMKAID